MLELMEVRDNRGRRAYLSFLYALYGGDTHYVDTAVFLVKRFLFQTDRFSRECTVLPYLVKRDGGIVAECMLLVHPGLECVQLAFFEALPLQQEAVDCLLRRAAQEARVRRLARIVVGLNGHVSYGVGLLQAGAAGKISFDSLYHKPYYTAYFERYPFRRQTLTAYRTDVASAKKLLEKFPEDTRFTYRVMDMSDFRGECRLLGKLCDAALGNTYLYFPTGPDHMYDLLKEMSFFLRPENLIFILEKGREIGFLFWHPDYNEIFRPGCKNSMLRLGWTYLTRRRRIQTVKINAVGLLPNYWKTGAVVSLLREAARLMPPQIKWTETNFVWDNNENSRKLNEKLNREKYRHYVVYLGEVEDGAV